MILDLRDMVQSVLTIPGREIDIHKPEFDVHADGSILLACNSSMKFLLI